MYVLLIGYVLAAAEDETAPELEDGNQGLFVVYGDGGKTGEHVPDLVSTRAREDGKPAHVAVELELSLKGQKDYLRILRFFRFTAYYGKGPLDAAGLSACVKLREGLARLSAERIWTEFKRILIAPRAKEAVVALFDYGFLSELLAGCACRFTFLSVRWQW